MIVFIDRQHAGKPNKLADRGATYDIDGDSSPEREAMITGHIALELEKILMLFGHSVMPISDGTYADRHKRVNEYAAMYPDQKCVYLAMHLNAGGGSYGAFFHHHASTSGELLAKYMAQTLELAGLGIEDTRVLAARPNDWTKNAFYTIRGIGRPVAICCEPCFMDNPDHAKILDTAGIQTMAMAMAMGIKQWGLHG
jgi:N-acetylmuramoyl-L-alanine amidase